MRRDTEICGAFDNFLGHGKAHVGVFGNARIVIRDSNDRHIIFFGQRQDQLQLFLFACHRIQQRAAFAGLQTGLECCGNRAVDT